MTGILLCGLSGFFVVLGLIFFLGSGIGILRFPDFYSRMHAAGKGDTLSTLLILLGLGIFIFHDGIGAGELITFIKIMAICAFIMLTSPTSTHALMEAGYEDGIEPLLGEDGVNPMNRKTKVPVPGGGNPNPSREAKP